MKRVLITMLAVLILGQSQVLAISNNTKENEDVFQIAISEDNYHISTSEDEKYRKVIVKDSSGDVNISIYDKTTGKIYLNGLLVDFEIINSSGYSTYSMQYMDTKEYKFNVVGMGVGGIVSILCNLLGIGGLSNTAISVLSSALSDNIIQSYISVRVHYYWDPETINQWRPNYIRKADVYAGEYFNRYLFSIG